MTGAFAWGLLAASSLVLGGLIALHRPVGRRPLGLVMAFGAGVLISAVAYELVEEAATTSAGSGGVGLGLLAGSLTFYGGDALIDRWTARPGPVAGPGPGGSPGPGAGLAIVLGAVLDGVPESVVLGLTVLEDGAPSAALLAAVFLSNLPEAIAATSDLAAGGWSHRRIVALWTVVALASGGAALAGYALLGSASPRTIAFVLAFAGGAILCMLTDTMVPEAYEHGGRRAGLATTIGFAVAFAIGTLG